MSRRMITGILCCAFLLGLAAPAAQASLGYQPVNEITAIGVAEGGNKGRILSRVELRSIPPHMTCSSPACSPKADFTSGTEKQERKPFSVERTSSVTSGSSSIPTIMMSMP